MTSETTPLRQQIIDMVSVALIGIPMSAPATEVNARLRQMVHRDDLPCSRSYYRRIVRQVQEERARFIRWEGGDPRPVRPVRATRARGVTR